MRSALPLCLAVLAASVACAQNVDLLADMSRWSANVDRPGAVMTLAPTADAPLAAEIVSDGKDEDYPKLRLMFDEPQDWSRFTRIKTRMRVTCDDPGTQRKRLAMVLYDRNTLRQDLPDHPMTQQGITHMVPVGDWMDYSDWLLDGNTGAEIGREAIDHIDLYIYEDSAEPHQYRWEFAQFTLEGVGEQAMVFDTEIYALSDLTAAASPAAVAVSSGDGLTLSLNEAGGISAVEADGRAVGGQSGAVSGLLVRDVAKGGPPVMVGGTLTAAEGIVSQKAEPEALGLAVEATYTGLGDRIEIAGKVRDLRGEDRAVTLYFALPLDEGPWTWWDNVARGRSEAPKLGEFSVLERGAEYGLYGAHSKYPLGTVSSPGRTGLSLAIRMDEPVVHRTGYNTANRLQYMAFDFGLTPETAEDGRSLAEAPFRIVLYHSDPAYGMRAALQRYYDFFPEFFEKRVTREGGWYVWGAMAETEGALEAGFGFHWGPSGNEAIKWDNEHNVTNVLYIEPELFQLTMGDYDRAPTAEECLERLRMIAAGDEEELAKFEKLGYSHSYVPGPWVAQHSHREAVLTVAKAAVASAAYNSRGTISAGISQYPWMMESQWGAIFPCNLDPDIAEGKGPFCRDIFIEPGLTAPEAVGAHYDGIGLDSFGGYGQFARANYRREHFKFSSYPLSFGANDKRVVLPAFMSSVEWVKDLAQVMHGRGMILMANCSWNTTPGWLTFAGPYLDVFGAEAASFEDPDYIRAIAYTKSCTDLPYKPRPQWEVPWHLLHGIFLGHGHDIEAMKAHTGALQTLAAAGWEPLNHAVADSARVQIERFGSGPTVYLVAHNTGNEPVTAEVTVDLGALGLEGCEASDLLTGEAVALESGRLTAELGDRGTVAVMLKAR